jgi:electron transfer flavoprotein alpha/beta subunit
MLEAIADKMPPVVSLKEHLKRARAARWKGKTKAEKSASAKSAANAYWSRLSPEERSAEMKRRASKRKKRKR